MQTTPHLPIFKPVGQPRLLLPVRSERKIEEEQQKLEEKVQTELRHMLQVRRRQAMRDLREKQLQTLMLLPAGRGQDGLREPFTIVDFHLFVQSVLKG